MLKTSVRFFEGLFSAHPKDCRKLHNIAQSVILFDEAQSLSWSVSYGKVTKTVSQPRKTKIGQFKREIETSKDFVNALKKAADKHPKCVVKPIIHMQKKGEASSYKGTFLSLSDARASQKTITFVPGRDGKVYERRTTNAGEFITPAASTGAITVLDEIRPGFQSSLPKIPYTLMEQALSLFRAMMRRGKDRRPAEALVHIYWDKLQQQYFIHVPKQLVSRASVDALLDNEALQDSDRYIHYADLHSHNQMPAVFSKTDDHDERPTRVYMVSRWVTSRRSGWNRSIRTRKKCLRWPHELFQATAS